ncbi:hypothetical protein PT286_02875 [Neisseriaceae bacterium ESL0693]|nr:hypothetical protein [Neisseriaceae bacterium ESL0693]
MSKWYKSLSPLPLDGRTAVSGRHMRTRFTWFVFRVYGLCGLLFVLSLIYQNNLTYLLAILLFFIGFYISYLSTKQLYGLVLEVIAEQEYFAGEPITLTLRVVPPLKWPRIIELYMDAEHMPEALDWQTWSIDASNMTFKCSIPPQPRGKLPPLILHCSSAAPFGQVRCEVCWRYESDIVVYPQPVKPALAADTSSIQTDGDVASAGLQGEDLAFLLPHQAGTSMHQIAWKQYAKNQQLLDKYFDQYVPVLASETISYRDYPDVCDKDKLAGLLCYRLLKAHRQGRPYQLELPQQLLSSDSASLSQCLYALGAW